MGEDKGQVGTAVDNENGQKSPEELRREIEETRQDLGDTAAALAEKTDVKARAKENVESVKQVVAEKRAAFVSKHGGGTAQADVACQASAVVSQGKAKAQGNPTAMAAVGAFVGGFIVGRVTWR